MQLPEDENEEGIPRAMEVRISALAAQASNVLLHRNQTEIAAQQAQQAAQDPVIQMQAQELQLKQAEIQRKAQKDQMEAQSKAQQLAVEQQRIASQERIAGAQINIKAAKDAEELQLQKIKDGFQIGKEIAESQKPQKPTKKD
jgi:hypothetical protein